MQVSVESTGNLERRMTFQVPAEQLESDVGGRLREMARTARIKGFRPGKVPTKVIEQRFGAQVRAEVLDRLLREQDQLALVFPEGTKGTGKPYSERYRLRPFNVGFVELAIASVEVVGADRTLDLGEQRTRSADMTEFDLGLRRRGAHEQREAAGGCQQDLEFRHGFLPMERGKSAGLLPACVRRSGRSPEQLVYIVAVRRTLHNGVLR